MISADLNDLLNLIAVTILADKRVFTSEVETFISATSRLQDVRHIEPRISEAKLLLWYEMNKDDLQTRIASSNFKNWFYGCLSRLDHIKNKRSIIKVMQEIAMADNELHVSEKALIALTANYWNINL